MQDPASAAAVATQPARFPTTAISTSSLPTRKAARIPSDIAVTIAAALAAAAAAVTITFAHTPRWTIWRRAPCRYRGWYAAVPTQHVEELGRAQ